MPPQLQQLLQNRRLLIIIGSGLAVLLALVITFAIMGSSGGPKGSAKKLPEDERVLATVDTMGKAIEVQALLARQNINLVRQDIEGGKATLRFQDDATIDDRDKALITLVQSGLMDKNVGLEVFDKGDLTASREEKRIKLVRARNGELARLIRKIPPIQDASVFISMPEPSIFKKDMTPVSATVQVTLNPGETLERDKVRAIINLLVGSIENLDAQHVSLSDTNGTVYNSVLGPEAESMDNLQQRDRYMEQKVRTQLDRLIGANNYSVTVSTYLREASKSELSLTYNPQDSSVEKSSSFKETLSAQQKSGQAGGATSSYLPPGVDNVNESEHSQRGYNRNGEEIQYNSGKKQVTEDFMPGMLEEITIAVSVDSAAYPSNMSQESLQNLIAHAASPMAKPENVTVVVGKPQEVKPISPSHVAPVVGFQAIMAGIKAVPWWMWAFVAGFIFMVFIALIRAAGRPNVEPLMLEQQKRELQELKELAQNQAQQLQNAQQQTQQILQVQREQMAQISSQAQQPVMVAQKEGAQALQETLSELKASLQEGRAEAEMDEEGLGEDIKSWIEST